MTAPDDTATLRLWLVRHGRTLFNDLGMAQGWCDSPLTAEGVRGVVELSTRLRDIEWAGVYASPSERAMDTAELIVGDRHPIVRDRRWKEYNFGVWEARPNEEVFTALADLTAPGAEPFSTVRGLFTGDYPALEGGETGAQYGARVAAALAELRASHASGDVLVVTHGMTVGVAATLVDAGFDFGRGMDNATFTVIEYLADGTAHIRAYGARTPEELRAGTR
jgi:probable phosphoglycerate mutase